MSRYNSRTRGINKNEQWEKILEERGVKEIEQYTTPRLKNPTEEQLSRIQTRDYIWKSGDRLWRLSARELGDPRLWWVLAKQQAHRGIVRSRRYREDTIKHRNCT